MINETKRPILWTIAGSDCSGGAGIQADIKTGHALGMEVCTLITANTVQNSQCLLSINPTPVSVLQRQLEVLLEDKPPIAIKIGLLANNAQLDWLTQTLQTLRQQLPELIVVCDPVMKASVGQSLMAESLASLMYEELIQLVDVITPNHCEAAGLANDFSETAKPSEWASAILEKGCPALLISGGHGDSEHTVTDKLFWKEQSFFLSSPKAQTGYGHGSGCTLSTALACFMAQGYLPRDAFIQAQAFMNKAFALCPQEPDYYGALIQPSWPVEKQFYPQVILNPALNAIAEQGFPTLGIEQLGLYPVVNSVEWLAKLMPLGLKIIQLRLKNQTETELRDSIQQAVALAKHHPQCRLFINDYWQLAIEYGAYGVHLGQEDLQSLSAEELKYLQQSGLRLGISTHGAYEFMLAQQVNPSYLAIGAIFPTRTKDMSGQIQGVDNLHQILKLRNDATLPIVAIGGITHDNAAEVIATGVNSIAVVTAITEAKNYQASVDTFKTMLQV
ncbi:thiamine phosphate synthase [Thiomicrorhabdus sp. zzn3]|uniref:thiamine phosphate synthase n=1 Tax=Thiomicrorhabdus sp. zzn3 TaxID=3039775 RepID=UPI002436809D|nr:thiamine phosphate synthase [Thiomicrorhabdus sp. zzn3]MDG6779081.1 thiamine phosphate synthase [Thiomicrorhabdus sp. zzn3]